VAPLIGFSTVIRGTLRAATSTCNLDPMPKIDTFDIQELFDRFLRLHPGAAAT